MSQRLKGQEVQIIICKAGEPQTTLTDIQNFNAEFQSETKTQGYLGEKWNQVDDIYNQTKFDLELNLHATEWFDFHQSILDRQMRVTPDLQFNILAVMNFPNGESPTMMFGDAKFGATPINISSRGDYVKVKLDGMCEVPQRI
jgi:hypothetical protein